MSWKQIAKPEGEMLSAWIKGSGQRYAIYWWPVSGYVTVWSFVKSKGVGKGMVQCPLPQRRLQPALNSDDRPYINLCLTEGIKPKPFTLHTLIYSHFLGDIPAGMVVRHKDDDPGNLRPDNLVLGTHSQNMLDAVRNGRIHKGSRLTPDDVRDIRQAYASGVPQPELAQKYHRSRKHVERICSGRLWRNVP